jgi:hypothetical protein
MFSNRVVSLISKWFAANKLTLIFDKTNIKQFITYNSPRTKLLGLQIDSHLNWKTHADQPIPKLCSKIPITYQQHRHPEISLFPPFSLLNDIQNNFLGKLIWQQEGIYITE